MKKTWNGDPHTKKFQSLLVNFRSFPGSREKGMQKTNFCSAYCFEVAQSSISKNSDYRLNILLQPVVASDIF